MKQFILAVILFATVSVYSQDFLPVDYPVKVKYTESGHTYLTGKASNGKVFLTKHNGTNEEWYREYDSPFPSPNDRGIDIAIDNLNNVYVTGYVYDDSYDALRIVVLKYSSTGGHQWATIFEDNDWESSGISIVVDENNNVYSCGFITDHVQGTERDFYVQRLAPNNGNVLWTYQYNDEIYKDDDVATSLLVDKSFLYVMGYSYRGSTNLNDIVLICLDKYDGTLEPYYPEIYARPNSNEYPTGFLFAEVLRNDMQKARTATGVSCDNINIVNGNPDYLTLFFKGGINSTLLWAMQFDGGNTDVPLSIAMSTNYDKVVVTGYSYSEETNYDFATIRYDTSSSIPGRLNVLYFDNENGIDQATSVVTGNDKTYVTGTSEVSQTGFYTVVYDDNLSEPGNIAWSDFYEPGFSGSMRSEKISYAVTSLDDEGNLLVTGVMADENGFRYCLYSYDSTGAIRFEYEDEGSNYMQPFESSSEQNGGIVLSNYPNPFNPITTINFTMPVKGLVTIKVYDLLGREVAVLTDGIKEAGVHRISFDASHLASGVYFYEMKTGNFREVKKMTLLK